jgi:hypothetical protein
MSSFVLILFRFARRLFSGHAAVAVENATRRLPAKTETTRFDFLRPPVLGRALSAVDWLARFPGDVRADTVVRWQREWFRRFWARLSRVNHRCRGRPAAAVEIRRLIERMATANPLWRAPRIHGELKMLGIELSERIGSLVLRKLLRPPSQTSCSSYWNTVAARCCTSRCDRASLGGLDVPADRRGLRRSECAPVSYTRSGWRPRQRSSSADRDTAYRRSAYRAPESLAESVRRTPDRLHTKRLPGPFRDPERQASYEDPDFIFRLLPRIEDLLGGLNKQCPIPRQASSSGRIVEIPQLGGLHHRYERVAA